MDGPVLVTERSVVTEGQVRVVVAEAELLPLFESASVPVTVAVFVTVPTVQPWIVGALKIRVSGTVWFPVTLPVQITLEP